MVLILLLIGTLFYHLVEGWSWIDSFYFCVIALTIVGFGDLSPSTPVSKIVTVFYIVIGIGILVIFVERLALYALKRRDGGLEISTSGEAGALREEH